MSGIIECSSERIEIWLMILGSGLRMKPNPENSTQRLGGWRSRDKEATQTCQQKRHASTSRYEFSESQVTHHISEPQI